MSETTCDLTDDQMASVQTAAVICGMSVMDVAAAAISRAIAARYVINRGPSGEVVPLESLKRRLRGPPKL